MGHRFIFGLIGLVVGGYFFLQKYQIDGLDKVTLRGKEPTEASDQPGNRESRSRVNEPRPGERPRRASQPDAYGYDTPAEPDYSRADAPPRTIPARTATHSIDNGGAAPPTPHSAVVRVASFNIQVFGEKKLAKREVAATLADIIRRFDVVAIQEVRAKSQDVLPQFVELINSTGRRYDYVLGPRLGRSNSKEQYAFIFDTQTIEVDKQSLYTVADPDDLLHREPLVGWFRSRGAAPEEAFTFSLVDIHTDPDETGQELDALDDVFRAVRNDGRGEDDVIILGDLNVDDRHLGQLGQMSGTTHAISGVASNTRGDKLYDNFVFSHVATTEFTGRAGVFDMIREFNLTMDEALQISDHMPIWAEFSVYEGGQAGNVAAVPSRFGRR